MAYAMLFPAPTKLRRKGTGSFLGKEQLLSKARTVLRETPELAIKVRDGFPLSLPRAVWRWPHGRAPS
jgi:hypothetical protein